MRIRWDPKGQRFPAFHGKYIVYADQGQLRVRSWPRKRGPSKSAAVRLQNAWFKDANRLAKHCAASQQIAAIEMTKGTGLYPRDLLLKSMGQGIIVPITADGLELQYRRPKVDPVSFQGFFLRLTADQNIGAGATAPINWPLPVMDTGAFWDVTADDRITVPPGVEVMQFFAGFQTAYTGWSQVSPFIANLDGTVHARCDISHGGQHAMTIATAPLPVTPGDQFRPTVFLSVGGILRGSGENYFGGIVLGAS